ncbi:glycosyltransferase family 4 protein [Psychrobacter maritimus]|uniref:glycosyltransferase family 4 protein n=1 Tax=Psychrobacter maritimus TaxID=256325 RepID=UPI00248B871B|nr:glycosyltransferase family 4 protein [Psychrobacter sp. WB2]WGV12252.1 glycosyltransferase family 4 protein [Psychrobacter sp. WB2]
MKFLIIASYPASISKFRGHLIKMLQNKGFEVHIASPEFNNHPEEAKELKELGYILHDIPMQRTGTNPLNDAKTLSALYLLMKKIKPSHVMGYTIKPVIYGSLAAKLARVPHRFALITGLGYAFQGADEQDYKKSTLQKVMHKLYSVALASTHKVFFQNPDDEALFRTMKILQPKASTTVVNGSGVDISEYSVQPFATIDDILIPRFLLIARLLGDKGVREYAQAAKTIKDKYPQAQFDLVGWIDDNPDAIEQQELDSWINEELFNFWGKLDDVKPAIAASSIYVLPSYREGTPRTVLEAMAMGRPIITTDAPGCRETVIDGYNGYLVPVKAVEELAAAMERFIVNPALIIEMGKASRQLVEEKFDVDAVNQSMLEAMGL